MIAVIKLAGIISAQKNERRIFIPHSFGNRLTGILIFLLPLTAYLFDAEYAAVPACTAAAVMAPGEFFGNKIQHKKYRTM